MPDEKPVLTVNAINAAVIVEELSDFITDNDPCTIKDSNDLMLTCIEKIESMRLEFKTRFRILKAELGDERYQAEYEGEYQRVRKSISAYIQQTNKLIQKVNTKSETINHHKATFLKYEMERHATEIKEVAICEVSHLSNEELRSRNQDLNKHSRTFASLSAKFKECIELAPSEFEQSKAKYEAVVKLWEAYCAMIVKEFKKREMEKIESFNKFKLNIKLDKFSVPTNLQADLLKNNHLEKDALTLVKNVSDIKEIWNRLKEAYGDTKTLLFNKISELTSCEMIRSRDPTKIINSISKISNLMRDLMQLSSDHHIENELYYSDAFDQACNLLGDERSIRWLTISCDEPKEGKWKWRQMLDFLDKEIKMQQQRAILQSKSKKQEPTNPIMKRRSGHHTSFNTPPSNSPIQDQTICFICGKDDHVQTRGPRGMKLIQYFSCKTFVDMTPAERLNTLKSKSLCFQCLFPGARANQEKHQEGLCQRDFICQNVDHQGFPMKKHILVCEKHKNNKQNQDTLEHYKSRCIVRQPVPSYSKEIKLSFHANTEDNNTDAIFMFQNILVDKKVYNIFYDSGCSDFISRHEAVKQLKQRAKQVYAGPILTNGVGNLTSESKNGIYTVNLPLANGKDAIMTGVCLDKLTHNFPMYQLHGDVINDIHNGFRQIAGDPRNLPSVPAQVGGSMDFMIGIQYLRYHPRFIFQLPSGLTIFESHFKSADGSRGIIGGPHKVFKQINQQHINVTNFVNHQFRLYSYGYHVNPDAKFLGYPSHQADIFFSSNGEDQEFINKVKLFEAAEHIGSEITFRCVNCRGCQACKDLKSADETMSVQEEIEQDAINRSVKVNINERSSVATLPLMQNPTTHLAPNRHIALKVYNQQLKRLASYPEDKEDILKSEKKLQNLGYVEYVKNLPNHIQAELEHNKIKNFIPWRAVWKENSISTPCRVVFDASMKTDTGYSLNDLLAKGRNNMNKLIEIFIRWRSHHIGIHTDVSKMYNSVQLDESQWCLQRYLWEDNLDPSKPPEEKVIKTLIYGIKSSGNQSERALRQTANIFKEKYPKVNRIINKDVYVDDCVTGEKTLEEAFSLADDLEVVVNHGGFLLKGFTFSQQKPHESLSSDGETVSVAGMKWFPESDHISIDNPEINFAEKYRGKKPKQIREVPKALTRRQCMSKVAEVFDIAGLVTPITATLKVDLHQLVQRRMNWDDVLPDSLRNMWLSHFEMLQEIKTIKFKRAVVPPEAINLEINTLDFGDASEDLICAAIYARFALKSGEYSCQLVFARSRLVPEEMTQPRAELYAALVNTHSGEVVRKSFQHATSIKFTDSQIALYWINKPTIQLKQWVRNRVNEIKRLTSSSQWVYIQSNDMVADIGTRRCTSINDVNQSSVWTSGHPWMRQSRSSFPSKTIEEINLTNNQLIEVQKEIKPQQEATYFVSHINEESIKKINLRYQFSKYLIDPNRHKFSTIVRIMAYVLRFINVYVKKQKSPGPVLTDQEIAHSENYFFKKATKEVKQFSSPAKYKKIALEKDGILVHVGRILPTSITVLGNLTKTMKDLAPTTFCVPIIDRFSPIAISLVNEVHWYNPTAKHSGNETTWRHVLQKAFIIEGKSLVKDIRSSCHRCRFILKKSINVEMGPLSSNNLCIAPAFYITQADLAGPFQAFSQHQKRTTVKIWLLVFCCSTTTCINIKVMEDYSTPSFIQAFMRFACQFGYPSKLLIDEGGQLTKGCQTMKFDFINIQQQLHKDMHVEFQTCPVGGHNMHGRVERKIKSVRSSLEKNLHLHRLSIIQWETMASIIGNSINNMPLAVNNITADVEMADLITPNRLLLGRNNERGPTGGLAVENDHIKLIRDNQKIYNAWFDAWLTTHVPNLVARPKWFNSDTDLKVGDVVLFLKQESVLCNTYQYGMVDEVERGRDSRIRCVNVRYHNASENCKRLTTRSSRSLVVIHGVDEIDWSKELDECFKMSQRT
eukprot:gene6911-biopygen5645